MYIYPQWADAKHTERNVHEKRDNDRRDRIGGFAPVIAYQRPDRRRREQPQAVRAGAERLLARPALVIARTRTLVQESGCIYTFLKYTYNICNNLHFDI